MRTKRIKLYSIDDLKKVGFKSWRKAIDDLNERQPDTIKWSNLECESLFRSCKAEFLQDGTIYNQ